jgi:YD repeat-containing protein
MSFRLIILFSLLILFQCLELETVLAASVSYYYDNIGRISAVRYENNVCVRYIYDASGNRLSQIITLPSDPNTPVWGTGSWGCFSWSLASHQ